MKVLKYAIPAILFFSLLGFVLIVDLNPQDQSSATVFYAIGGIVGGFLAGMVTDIMNWKDD